MKIYLSHPIRGIKGNTATEADMQKNCYRARMLAYIIRRFIIPPPDIYCPAESEPFIGRAYKSGILTEKQILDIDCEIIKDCDLLIIYNPERGLSNGMKVEFEAAKKSGVEVYEIGGIDLDLINFWRNYEYER